MNYDLDTLVSEKEAAKILGIAPITLRIQRYNNRKKPNASMVPYIAVGDKTIRYSMKDLQAFINANRVTGA